MAEAAALCALIRATFPDLRGVDVERSVRVDLTALIRDWMAG